MNCRPEFDDASILARYPRPERAFPGDPEPQRKSDETLSWYAVRTATRREVAATKALQEQGFTVFLPMQTTWSRSSRWQDRQPVSRPLLPGYIFVSAVTEDLGRVRGTDAVHDIVGCSDDDGSCRAMPIPIAGILEIQVAERRGEFDYTRNIKVPYRPKKGARVKISAGPWLGFIAKVLSTPRGERAHLMVEGPFGRGATVDVAYLAPAS